MVWNGDLSPYGARLAIVPSLRNRVRSYYHWVSEKNAISICCFGPRSSRFGDLEHPSRDVEVEYRDREYLIPS